MVATARITITVAKLLPVRFDCLHNVHPSRRLPTRMAGTDHSNSPLLQQQARSDGDFFAHAMGQNVTDREFSRSE